MKNILFISILLAFNIPSIQSKERVVDVASDSCLSFDVSSNSPNTLEPALITSDGKAYSNDCFSSFLNQLVSSLDDPLVLFVHGRGKHPSKAFKNDNRLLQRIEEQYGVTAIMFTWDSWCGKICLPKKEAIEAGRELLNVIRLLGTIKTKTKTKQKFSLLTHSMGAYVLKGLASLPQDDVSTNTFSNLLISASATPAKNHREWVDMLKISTNTYVMNNKKDNALKCIEGSKIICRLGFNQPKLLGRWGDLTSVKSQSESATRYVDLSGLIGKTHRYYINQRKKSPKVFELYKTLLNGQVPQ